MKRILQKSLIVSLAVCTAGFLINLVSWRLAGRLVFYRTLSGGEWMGYEGFGLLVCFANDRNRLCNGSVGWSAGLSDNIGEHEPGSEFDDAGFMDLSVDGNGCFGYLAVDADDGRIIKDGVDITNTPSAQRRMGIVFQNYALFENMSVLNNVTYALRNSAATKEEYDKASAVRKAKEMLDLVGLSEHIDKKPRELSGGQQQRVAIARTLALNPDVILFDEPMSALDVDTRLSLRSELKELQKKFGTTMIYITHDQEEAFAMSDRIMVMDAGRIHQLDSPQNIIDNPADDYVKRFVIKNINIKINSLIQFARSSDKGDKTGEST